MKRFMSQDEIKRRIAFIAIRRARGRLYNMTIYNAVMKEHAPPFTLDAAILKGWGRYISIADMRFDTTRGSLVEKADKMYRYSRYVHDLDV